LTAELVPAWAAVTFRSQPPGATVRVDGNLEGTTPTTAEVIAGSHAVEIVLDGYKPHRQRIEVVANQPLDLPTVSLAPSDGSLTVNSDPAEALVTVDGTFRGSTPVDIELAPGAEYQITVSKSGYEPKNERVRIESGENRRLSVKLSQHIGQITVTSRPPNAELLVDGEVRGSTGQTLQLTATAHELEVRLQGYEPFRTTVTPQPGVPESLEVTLQQVGATSGRPKVVQTAQGVELKLIPPGRFTMGASRREPGRRANETLREVEVTRAFYLAVREVSNREFREFRTQHRSGTAGRHSLETDHHPVVRVTWDEAARYCNWLSEKQGLPPVYVERDGSMVSRSPVPAGYRLPTEAEWAWAARVPSGTSALKYAWGNNLPIPEGTDNYGDQSAGGLLGGSLPDYNDSEPVTAPVGSFQPNARGLFNMGGNVSEWVHDVYTIYPSAPGSLATDPTGPPEGEYHVIRGASWMDESVSELRLSYRDYGDEGRADVGFRIAKNAE
jgi:formylglycine-generating enzyme required for sulfatase activity